jgi:hypothetical protein
MAYGTFLAAPSEYAQLFVIYGQDMDFFYPMIYVLTEDRT